MTLSFWQRATITVALAVAYWYLFGCGGTLPSDAFEDDNGDATQGKLADAYRTYNDKFFYGGLPEKNTRIEMVKMPGYIGRIHHFRSNDTWLISIDTVSNQTERVAEFTLIHEQCHQYDQMNGWDEGPDQHGEVFQNCMLRIANQGGFRELW